MHQINIKYLLAYPSAGGKTEFLYAATPVLGACFLCIWKYFHGAVTDVDKAVYSLCPIVCKIAGSPYRHFTVIFPDSFTPCTQDGFTDAKILGRPLRTSKPHPCHFAQVQIATKKLSFTQPPLLFFSTFQMFISWAYSRYLLFIPCV